MKVVSGTIFCEWDIVISFSRMYSKYFYIFFFFLGGELSVINFLICMTEKIQFYLYLL